MKWYSRKAKQCVENQSGIEIIEEMVKDIVVNERKDKNSRNVKGVILSDGSQVACNAFILCSGTFLHGIMYTGTEYNNWWKIW